VYLDERDVSLLKNEDEFVRKRYRAVARTVLEDELLRIPRREAARLIGRSRRQMQRIVRRFSREGIPGLRPKSRRPHSSPNRVPPRIEERVLRVREATGFGAERISLIVNQGLRREGATRRVSDTACYNVLVRNGLVEAERRLVKEYRSFEWGRPDELIQCDLTSLNGMTLLTMEDDHSRRGWAVVLKDERDSTVVEAMEELHPSPYGNLLTDNGSQFSRKDPAMKRYCEGRMTRHIWSSVHHPQTMGKLSNFQKGLKRFLRHRLGRARDRRGAEECIEIYLDFYNNAMAVRTTGSVPEERYSGHPDEGWYERMVFSLKLEKTLPVSCVGGG
jgi:hypothetical protein